MTIKNHKRHTRGSKSKAKKLWEKRAQASRKKARHEPKGKDMSLPENNDECVVCYSSVPIIENNIQRCNKATHTLCAHCKLILLNDNRTCPLCRQKHVRRPVVPIVLNIYKR